MSVLALCIVAKINSFRLWYITYLKFHTSKAVMDVIFSLQVWWDECSLHGFDKWFYSGEWSGPAEKQRHYHEGNDAHF